MRILALVSLPTAIAAAACLSAPTGQPADAAPTLTWPPANLNLVGLGSGKVDGDAFDDLIALDASNGGNVYLLRGGVDVRADLREVTTYTRHAALAGLRAPATATVAKDAGGTTRVVVLDNPPDGPRITVFDGDLTSSGDVILQGEPPAPPLSAVTLHPSPFGMNGGSVIGSTPEAVFFIEAGDLDDGEPTLRLPMATVDTLPFTAVLAVDAYLGGGPRFVVSQAKVAQRADAGMTWSWTTLRDDSALPDQSWSVQTTAMITTDPAPDVVAFDRKDGVSSQVCVIDAEANLRDCVDTPFRDVVASNIAVGELATAGAHDLAILTGGAMASLFLFENLTMTGGQVMGGPPSMPANFNLAGPLMTLAQLDTGVQEIVLVGRMGQVQCVKGTTAPPSACTP